MGLNFERRDIISFGGSIAGGAPFMFQFPVRIGGVGSRVAGGQQDAPSATVSVGVGAIEGL